MCPRSFSEYDESRSTLCTLKSENNCFISFSVVAGDMGSTVYNLKMYGKVNATPWARFTKRFLNVTYKYEQ